MYLAARALGRPVHMWIQEYDAFPLFGKAGGLPFPLDDAGRRAATIRKTLRALRLGTRTLILFPEGVLHRPSDLLPFGEGLELLRRNVQGLAVVPAAIRYELSMHERPECWIEFGEAGEELEDLVERLGRRVGAGEEFELLHSGTKDVNERWDMRRLTGRG
jgi:1-acyl-sn-glycerol-3-phosphate acyltransferase